MTALARCRGRSDRNVLLACLVSLLVAMPMWAQAPATRPARHVFARGLPNRADYFPIAVWLQQPANAARYKAIGVNLYVGLWQGPTEAQLAELEKAAMPVICAQNEFGLKNANRRIIVGWMHDDEPDNAQSLGEGKGYGPPVEPRKVIADFQRFHEKDPTRPVLLNLGQGVAWDEWYGRGVRTNHPEDYVEYAKAADILSFDIYPVTHDRREVAGRLWYVGQGVERLRKWSGDDRPVWACIETTHIGNPRVRPTPEQIRSIVWMAVIHGARGILYFAHEFQPSFVEAGLLAHADVRTAVGQINAQITELAPVLNGPTVFDAAVAESLDPAVPIRALNKRHDGATYVLAITTRQGRTEGRFIVAGRVGRSRVTVLGEDRTIEAVDGRWRDAFSDYAVHLYRVAPPGRD